MKQIIMALIGLAFAGLGLGAFEELFVNFTALVLGTTFFAEALINNLKAKEFTAQLISWGSGILLAFGGWFLDLGFLIGMAWWQVALTGLGAALAANGVWDTQWIKLLLKALGILKE